MNKVLMAVALGTAFISIPASAQLYIGTGIGTAITDAKHTSYKFFAGDQFDENFGVEVAYTDLGGYRGASANSRSIVATGTLPVSDRWDVFGKVGGSLNRTGFSGSASHLALFSGIGICYNINKKLSVRFDHSDFGKLPDDSSGIRTQASSWTFNVKLLF